MNQWFQRLNADTAGIFTSLLCAIHCAAFPVLVSIGVFGQNAISHNHTFDWLVIGIGIVIAFYSLVGDYFKVHKNVLPVGLAIIGFALLLIGMIDHHGWMLVFSVLGGLTVGCAHILNHRLHKACQVAIK